MFYNFPSVGTGYEKTIMSNIYFINHGIQILGFLKDILYIRILSKVFDAQIPVLTAYQRFTHALTL